jgi:serine phosphatase RsbU (regulator of sigma subunit)
MLVLVLELKDKLLARNELESGRAVQRAMQPDASPSVPGWDLWLYTRSANEVGGDLVDFLRLDGGRYAVAIGDVAGKGLGAALFMVKIQSTLRALAPDCESVERLAAKVNAILLRDGMPGKFASLFFARFGPENGHLQFFNAGHMPPLILSADGIEELSKGNAALGLSAASLFETREVRLANGESMVVYSDGVTEAQNQAGEFHGLDRLRTVCREGRMMRAQALGEKILAGIAAFEGNARRTDDLSLVILRRTA